MSLSLVLLLLLVSSPPSTVAADIEPVETRSTAPLRLLAVGLGSSSRRSKYAGFVQPGLVQIQSLCTTADRSDVDGGDSEEEGFPSTLLPMAPMVAWHPAAGGRVPEASEPLTVAVLVAPSVSASLVLALVLAGPAAAPVAARATSTPVAATAAAAPAAPAAPTLVSTVDTVDTAAARVLPLGIPPSVDVV